MDPLNINFIAQDQVKRAAFQHVLVPLIAIVLAGILSYNLLQWYNNQEEINTYRDQTEWIARQRNVGSPSGISKHFSEDQIKALTDHIKIINQLIKQDIFPWSLIIQKLEQSIPESINLTGLSHVDTFEKIILDGESGSLADISLFITNLHSLSLFDRNILTSLTIAESDNASENAEKYQFRVECVLNLDVIIETYAPKQAEVNSQ